MKYKEKWWQFWRPVCQCPNVEQIDTYVTEEFSGGPDSTPSSAWTAMGDWRWYVFKCKDCGKITKDGHWE